MAAIFQSRSYPMRLKFFSIVMCFNIQFLQICFTSVYVIYYEWYFVDEISRLFAKNLSFVFAKFFITISQQAPEHAPA